jgi:segregation and condensation protein B
MSEREENPVEAEAAEGSAGEQPQAQPEGSEQPDGAVVDAHVDAPDGAVVDVQSDAAVEGGDAEEAVEERVDLGIMEALLFSTHHPLTAGRLAELLELGSTKPIRKAIKDLNQQYDDAKRCFRVEQVAGGYQLLTLPEYGDFLKKLHQKEADAKLTKAALETLAIVAYKQPILRVDVEAIRGVACGETIRSLMEKHLVKIAGRAEEPGRPILYGTTKRFLELFGLNSLKDLPQSEDPTTKARQAKAKAQEEAKAGQAKAEQPSAQAPPADAPPAAEQSEPPTP